MQTAKDAAFSKTTVIEWHIFFHNAANEYFIKHPTSTSGPGKAVEVGKTVVTRKE